VRIEGEFQAAFLLSTLWTMELWTIFHVRRRQRICNGSEVQEITSYPFDVSVHLEASARKAAWIP
jgi:hypothetical protein